MTTLNKKAAEVITTAEITTPHVGADPLVRPVERSSTAHSADAYSVHAMTDITGFGLIGHLREMLLASNVSARIAASAVPLLEGALECVNQGHIPGGLNNNRDFAECAVEYDANVPEDLRTILYDPQTAGGLLIAAANGEHLLSKLQAAAIPAAHIGEIREKTKPLISVAK